MQNYIKYSCNKKQVLSMQFFHAQLAAVLDSNSHIARPYSSRVVINALYSMVKFLL